MSGIRYQPLPTEDSHVTAEPAQLTLAAATVVASTETAPVHGDDYTAQDTSEAPPSYFSPPSYTTATSLPSYEEAEESKAREASSAEVFIPLGNRRQQRSSSSTEQVVDRDILGSDMLFLLAFFMAFLFNWLGLMLAFCLSATMAARYGGLSGFGLSMIKWFTIMRHTKYVQLHERYDEWLFWLVVACGLLLFVHGIGQYLRAKFIVARRERGAGVLLMQ